MVSVMGAAIKHLSRRIIASYVLDWIVILATAILGAVFSKISGNSHVFSLIDPAISYPTKSDTVPTSALMVVCTITPALIILIVSLVFVPGRTAAKGTSPVLRWRRKLWEWNTGWMGLCLSLAGTLMMTEGLKNLVGKPRPDFLARCDPDLSLISQYAVSGLGALVDNAPIMVDYRICRNQSKYMRSNGFSSWPSGHASFSWAGMLYLTLFLCAKFSISIPYLAPRTYSRDHHLTAFESHVHHREDGAAQNHEDVPLRNQAAAPPVYLLILAFVPIGTAFFITTSRYADYRHAGFDIISGAVLGSAFAYFSFRWYHLPIRTGAGWSWGARSKHRAFYAGLGIPTYIGEEGWTSSDLPAASFGDLESGEDILGSGRPDQVAGEGEIAEQRRADTVSRASSQGESKDVERSQHDSSSRST